MPAQHSSPATARSSTPVETVEVRVSVASALQRFHGCEPDYIRDVFLTVPMPLASYEMLRDNDDTKQRLHS